MNAEQQIRLGKLLAMGIPLPIALPLAVDPNPEASVAAGLQAGVTAVRAVTTEAPATGRKVKRRASGYSRKYKAAFKKVSPRYKKKNGQWKANGFRAAVRAAHKEAKK